jgi:hypothetical protein
VEVCPDAPVATVVTFLSKLSAAGFTLLLCAAALGLVAVLLRTEASAEWRDWRVGAWAPREEFTPKGWYFALGARVLTGLGLLLHVLGMPGSAGRQ